MRWLLALETDNDPIPACRLMNVFRRKSVQVVTLALAAEPAGFSLLAVVESRESDVEHVFHFLRGVGGVRRVSYYRHEASAEAAFVLIDAEAGSSSVERFLRVYPASRLALASQGKYLYEIPAENATRWAASGLAQPEFLPFARVKTSLPRPELVGAIRNSKG
jgi:hypothetical protein